MGDVVIVAYRPKPGHEAALLDLTRSHVPQLRSLGLATERPGLVLRAADGVVVEVFEWAEGGIDAAHSRPEVTALWARYAEVCDVVKLRDLREADMMFAQFRPL